MPESPSSDEPLDEDPGAEAYSAYLRACDTGEMVSRESFLAQYPEEIAKELRDALEAADAMDQFIVQNSTQVVSPISAPGAETINGLIDIDGSGDDPAATLPEANRPKGDPGPTLPYDLGDYELIEVVGRGGMGVVYRATQRMLDRTVAVKMIRGGMLACENDVRRFYTEAQAAAGLHHPSIVPVYQFGHRAGHHFFSMALIEGTDLQKKINEEEMSIEDAARYVRDVAMAIDHAHRNDVLHRDVKPANILIDQDGKVHITDFGLAKNLSTDSSVTGSGAAVGTPNYMAPEQAGGHSDRATRQSDVYSLGAILFACVTGRPPLVGDSVVETLLQVVHDPPPTMRSLRSGVPADLETIVAKCLEKDPKKRFKTARALANDLHAFLEGRPIDARPRGRILKVWHWTTGVPLVGALIGRKVVGATAGHRRFQAAMLLMLALMPFLIVGGAIVWNRHIQAMPDKITIAGGLDRGVYNGISEAIGQRIVSLRGVEADVIGTGGSVDNRRRLINRSVHLAPMQASAISGAELCVVAPLIYEAAHLLVRKGVSPNTQPENDSSSGHSMDLSRWTVGQLRGGRIAVGPVGSGSRQTADMILASLELAPDVTERVVIPWPEIEHPSAPNVALICVGRGSSLVNELLESGWVIKPIPKSIEIAEQHPTLRPITVSRKDYPASGISESGLSTLGTIAYLAARRDAPSVLVRSALEALYEPPLPLPGLIPADRAAEWQGLAFHTTARQYFAQLRETGDQEQ